MNTPKLSMTGYSAIAMMAVTVTIGGAPFLRAADPSPRAAAPGEERRWTLDFRTRLEQQGGVRPVEIAIGGDWISTVSAVRSGEYDAELRLEHAHAGNPAGQATVGRSQQWERRLERPFWATYRNDGALVAVHFYKDVDPADRNLLQMIATECQFVHAAPERASWSVLERDGAGEYLANYSRTNSNAVTKQKAKYVHTDGAPGKEGVRVEIDRSEGRFVFGADGGMTLPETMDTSVRVRIAVAAGDANQLTAVTETHLSNLRKRQAPETMGSLARALSSVESSAVRTQQPDPEQLRARLDDRLLEGRSSESLLDAALAGATSTGEDRISPDRLAALFRQRPEAAALALDRLRKSGPHSRVTDALGAAGSPAAVAALGALANDNALPRPLRIDALTAFILMQHPSAEAIRTPSELLDDSDAQIASAARIASGALARAGRAAHPEASEAVDRALDTRYRQARSEEELIGLLAAMGNSCGEPVTPAIESALSDPRQPVRTAAARALRLAAGPEVEGLLSGTIVEDRDASVRAAAIFASSFRNPFGAKLAEALVYAAKMDPAEQVRASAITLLRRHSGAVPNLAETLQCIVEHDPKPGVRRLAQDALNTL